jgi:hypothetical protein
MRSAATTLATIILLTPLTALAFPFGGQASTVVPCYNQAIFARLGAPRGGDYIWTPATRTYQFGPPSHAGQWLLGLASAPYYCVVSIEPVIVWPGTAIDMMGSSGGGSTYGLLHGGTPTTAAPPGTPYSPTMPVTQPSAPAQTIGHVVVSEVFYNVDAVHGKAPNNQWVELYNGSSAAVDISKWQLQDSAGLSSLPSGISLGAGQFALVVAGPDTPPLWSIPSSAKIITLNTTSIAGGMGVAGDSLTLKDGSGTPVDALSWGTNVKVFNPAPAQSLSGYSLSRKTLTQDTDTASDWAASSIATPGH